MSARLAKPLKSPGHLVVPKVCFPERAKASTAAPPHVCFEPKVVVQIRMIEFQYASDLAGASSSSWIGRWISPANKSRET